jgi:hypothetical protein
VQALNVHSQYYEELHSQTEQYCGKHPYARQDRLPLIQQLMSQVKSVLYTLMPDAFHILGQPTQTAHSLSHGRRQAEETGPGTHPA